MGTNLITAVALFSANVALFWGGFYASSSQAPDKQAAVSIIFVRHGETDTSLPTQPLSEIGRRRVELLGPSLQSVRFTHVFASHTTRARETVTETAAANQLPIVQLPAPGSLLGGRVVDDTTPRGVASEPIASALMHLPPGSVALVALNSENMFAVLNRLGVPVPPVGEACLPGSMCVPCADGSCFPRSQYDKLWHLVRRHDQAVPESLIELRYGVGWLLAEK